MSAAGQFVPKFDVRVRSAFHPIPTKSRTSRRFGFGPLSESCTAANNTSLDNLVGGREQRSGHGKTDLFCRFLVYDQFKLDRRLHWKDARARTL